MLGFHPISDRAISEIEAAAAPADDVPNTALLACITQGVVAITAAGMDGVLVTA